MRETRKVSGASRVEEQPEHGIAVRPTPADYRAMGPKSDKLRSNIRTIDNNDDCSRPRRTAPWKTPNKAVPKLQRRMASGLNQVKVNPQHASDYTTVNSVIGFQAAIE